MSDGQFISIIEENYGHSQNLNLRCAHILHLLGAKGTTTTRVKSTKSRQIGVVHKLRNHFLGAQVPPCNIVNIWTYVFVNR